MAGRTHYIQTDKKDGKGDGDGDINDNGSACTYQKHLLAEGDITPAIESLEGGRNAFTSSTDRLSEVNRFGKPGPKEQYPFCLGKFLDFTKRVMLDY